MPGLILKLRANEQIMVNGVVMQNGDRNARLIIKTPDAKILRLRDAIHPDDVDTPVKRICYVAQLAVAGEVTPEDAAKDLSHGIAQLADALTGVGGTEPLQAARAQLRRRNFYACLRQLRRLLPLEATLLEAAQATDAAAVQSYEASSLSDRQTPSHPVTACPRAFDLPASNIKSSHEGSGQSRADAGSRPAMPPFGHDEHGPQRAGVGECVPLVPGSRRVREGP
ncbi:MAG: flagellar biosynthesis repressor FlbT [Pseudomonadota bacterium]